MLILRKLLRYSDDVPPASAFSYAMAESYYLPEGRYYAAPAVYKNRRKSHGGLSALVGLGFFCLSASALTQNPPLPVPANITVFAGLSASLNPRLNAAVNNFSDINGDGENSVSERYRGRDRRSINGDFSALSHHAALREDIVNRSGKGASVLAALHNNRPRLVNYDVHYSALAQNMRAVSFAAALEKDTSLTYGVRFQRSSPVRNSNRKDEVRIAAGFVPAPVKKAPASLPVPQMLASLVNNDKPDILALGYADIPQASVQESPFDRILTDKDEDKNSGRFIPPIGHRDHSWAAMPLPADVFSRKQQKCLSEAIYFEARSESLKGQAAIAQVVLNRVRNPVYPDTICNVVYQNTNLYNRCQFSFACDGIRHKVTEKQAWRTAQQVARAVSAGQIWLSDIGSSTHYHAVYVRPHWANVMDKMEKIGSHVFYRTKGGGWS